ncbi:hypothetical protein TELCIR_10575 [Teladorsagia circumcincta]|uniref:Uncharacterized protein n=1 Tax=Teladorsagia circumcincta TaxID=45464 RepID=A0A2G9UBR8_TELCI|nr:hypothetical protein TELCIR_10575 [Teladorsagia circumcincta]
MTGTPTMARVMANIVDMQQHLVSQYQTVQNSLESLKLEVHNSTQSIREELRRTDDRAQKQVDDLRVTHANEVTRLMELVKMLVAKDQGTSAPPSQPAPPEAPRMTPAQIAYANAAPASGFFGPPAGSFNDLAAQAQAHYAACYLQQLQEQQRMRSAGMQATGFFGNQPAVNMGGVGIPGAFPQSQHAAPMAPATAAAAPKPSTAAPIGAVPPITASAPIPPSSTGFPVAFTSAAPVSTSAPLASSAPSVTYASSLAPTTAASSGLFMGAAKPALTAGLYKLDCSEETEGLATLESGAIRHMNPCPHVLNDITCHCTASAKITKLH